MLVSRKLKEIGKIVDLMVAQKDLGDFLNNPGNSQRLNGLMEDICCALMNYQVYTSTRLPLAVPNICLRLHYNKTSVMRAVSKL